MTLVLRSTDIQTVRRARTAVDLRPRNDVGPAVIENADRYQAIGSLQALALAVAASVVTVALLRLVL